MDLRRESQSGKGEIRPESSTGDVIYFDISGSQNDDAVLFEVIDQLRDHEIGLILVKIDHLSRTETGKVEITVQFGENVCGYALVGAEMNILTPDSASDFGSSVEGLFWIIP